MCENREMDVSGEGKERREKNTSEFNQGIFTLLASDRHRKRRRHMHMPTRLSCAFPFWDEESCDLHHNHVTSHVMQRYQQLAPCCFKGNSSRDAVTRERLL